MPQSHVTDELEPTDVDVETGRLVQAALAEGKRTQAELGALLGVDQGSISKRLRGLTRWKVGEVYKTAEWLGVPVDELLPEASA